MFKRLLCARQRFQQDHLHIPHHLPCAITKFAMRRQRSSSLRQRGCLAACSCGVFSTNCSTLEEAYEGSSNLWLTVDQWHEPDPSTSSWSESTQSQCGIETLLAQQGTSSPEPQGHRRRSSRLMHGMSSEIEKMSIPAHVETLADKRGRINVLGRRHSV